MPFSISAGMKASGVARAFVPAVVLFALSGCVATTTDVDRLQESLNRVQKGQADLVVKMDDLDEALTRLTEKLEESDRRMGTLTQKLDDSQTRIGGRLETVTKLLSEATSQATVAVPGELYRTAYSDYLGGKIDLAISGFKTYLDRYPESDLADDAQYYYADCYLVKQNFGRAREEFDKVLGMSREYRVPALLKRSYALAGLDMVEDQKHTLKTLIKEAPQSQEAETARQILEELEPPAPKKKPAPASGGSPSKKKSTNKD